MKILIWDMFDLRNTGGPSGYLYNIRQYLNLHPDSRIVFLSDIVNQDKATNNVDTSKPESQPLSANSGNSSLKKNIWRFFLSWLKHTPNLKGYITKWFDYSYRVFHMKLNGLVERIDLSEYDYIHFHMLLNFRQFKNTFPNYKGKTILTSHCPCPWTDEMIASDRQLRIIRHILIRQECKTYRSADYLMFPCPQAKEPYEHDRIVRSTLNHMSEHSFYVPSSIIPESDNQERLNRSNYNLPEDAFVVGFFGRHNSIKGYDILKEIGQQALDKIPNLHFLCAGAGDIPVLTNPRWHELGYISNVHEVMKLCDMYVLPNRETYFDLVVIESLRAGLVLSMSETGGNKYFLTLPKEETDGLFFFDIDDIKSAVNHIKMLSSMKQSDILSFCQLKVHNINLYKKYFTTSSYVDSYISAVSKLK